MADPHVISALKNKRADLTGRIIVLRKEIAALEAAVRYCDGALTLFDSDLDPETIKPRVPQFSFRTFGHGEMARLALETLCEAGEPLETSEITRRLATAKELPTEGPVFKEMQRSVLGVLNRQRKIGVLAVVNNGPSYSLVWSVAD